MVTYINTYISHCWKWRNVVVVVYSNAYHILLHTSLTHTSTNLDTKVCTMFLCNTFWSGRLAIVLVVTRWFIHFLAFAKIAKKKYPLFAVLIMHHILKARIQECQITELFTKNELYQNVTTPISRNIYTSLVIRHQECIFMNSFTNISRW